MGGDSGVNETPTTEIPVAGHPGYTVFVGRGLISDLATYAYLADVFIVEDCRRRGLGDWLVESIRLHPQLQGLRRFALITRDAGPLYARHGFIAPPESSGYMEIVDREVYGTR